MNKFVYISEVDVYDDVFTEERASKWKKHLYNCYVDVFNDIESKLSSESDVNLFLDMDLLGETAIDAIIGMRKITSSTYNAVDNPNTFKIAAYLVYWWLRHKPVSYHCKGNFFLKDIKLSEDFADKIKDAKENEHERQKLIWQLKHINELVAVQAACTFIFQFDQVVCDKSICNKVQRKDSNFGFNDFEEMRDALVDKLTYYFAYRAITPKVIEHILEGYTFHPAWKLSGKHWGERL